MSQSSKTYELHLQNPLLQFQRVPALPNPLLLRVKLSDLESHSSQPLKPQSQSLTLFWEQIFVFQEISPSETDFQIELVDIISNEVVMKVSGDLDLKTGPNQISIQCKDCHGLLKFNLLVKQEQTQKQQTFRKNLNLSTDKQSTSRKQQQQDQERIQIQKIVRDELKRIEFAVFRKQEEQQLEAKENELDELIEKRKKTNNLILMEANNPYIEQLENQRFKNNQEVNTEQQNTVSYKQVYGSRLVEIAKCIKSKFGDRIFENQSATTMQKSIHCYSVPKGPRFINMKYNGVQPSYHVPTCFDGNTKKGTSFGFGKRKPFPDWMERNMKQIPAPNTYLQSTNRLEALTSPKGFSFGLPYSYFQKVTIVGSEPLNKINQKTLIKVGSVGKLHSRKDLQKTPQLSQYHYSTTNLRRDIR